MVEPLPDWAPEGVDVTKPSIARMYDYYLGGSHNFDVDRELARQIIALVPEVEPIARANRAFLRRAVRYLMSQGVRQFIDVGSGIPSVGNVHDIAENEASGSRVLYVDHDPVAVAHSQRVLRGNSRAQVVEGDVRRPGEILEYAENLGGLDLSQPVAVLMSAVLHFVTDGDRPEEAIRQFRDRLAPGSYLAISHLTGDARPGDARRAAELYEAAADPITIRSRARIGEFFEGWDLVAPGLVWLTQWRPEQPGDVGSEPWSTGGVVGVGRKP